MKRIVTALALALCSLDLAAAISGHVIDEDGKPIAGARVRAIALTPFEVSHARILSSAPEPVALATTETNAGGAFRVDTKREPVVAMLIDAPGYSVVQTEVADGDDAGAFMLRKAPMKKGRVTANGKPVAGAWVMAGSAYFARTDEAGEYSIPDPAGWIYTITVVHPEYAIAEISRTRDAPPRLDIALEKGSVVRGRVVDPAGRPIANATVYAGLWPLARSGDDGSFTIAHLSPSVKSLNAREGSRIGIAKPGAETIVLRPTSSVLGTVRSSKDDAPVAGMRIFLRGEPGLRFPLSAVTDARGRFALEGLPAGVSELDGVHPGFARTTAEVNVGEGGRVETAMVATPIGRLQGTVVDEQKKAVSGALVAAFGPAPRTHSAPDGTFTVRISPGERPLTIDVSKTSYASATHGPVRIAAGETKAGVRIVLPRGTRREIRLVDRDGVAIAGEPVAVSPQSDSRSPFRGAVRCESIAEAVGCRTNAQGKVAFNVADAAYDIRAGGLNTVEKQLRGHTFDPAESTFTIELQRGAVIEGHVVWSDGSPVTTPVTVIAPGAGYSTSVPVVDGAFTIRNVPPGKVSIAAQTMPPSMMQGEPVEVTAPANGVLLELPRFGRIEGRVMEREGRQPVKQFRVSVEPRGRFRGGSPGRAFTTDEGRFVLEDVPPGTVDVVVTAPGFARSRTASVEVQEAKASSVELSLDRAGKVSGRITAGGQPVAGARVFTDSERGGGMTSARQTDANGEYVLDTIAPGTHDLMIRKEGFLSKTITVNVEAGKDVRGDAELARGREVSGRVLDANGKPVPGAQVMSMARRRDFYSPPAISDAEGNFRLEGLPDEPLTVVATKDDYAQGTVDVNPATTSSVTITLQRGGTLRGRVTGLSPEELAFVEISVMGQQQIGRRARNTVDATGAFTLGGISDGDVVVTAQQMRPPRRRVSSNPVSVVAGSGPFVEIDFNAGFLVRGRVTRRGQGVGGSLYFAPVGPGNRSASAIAEIRPDGTYETRIGGAGEYRVMATIENTGATIETGRVDVRGDMTHDVDVRGAAIRGRVVDSATRAPVPDARVSLMMKEGRSGTEIHGDSSGRFAFEFVADGRNLLRAFKPGYATEPLEVVVNGADAEVELFVTRGEPVVVQLVDASTGRAVQAYVSVLDAAQTAVSDDPPVTASAEGGYRYWLKPGNYSLRTITRDYEPKTVPLVVPGTPVVRIELTPVKRD